MAGEQKVTVAEKYQELLDASPPARGRQAMDRPSPLRAAHDGLEDLLAEYFYPDIEGKFKLDKKEQRGGFLQALASTEENHEFVEYSDKVDALTVELVNAVATTATDLKNADRRTAETAARAALVKHLGDTIGLPAGEVNSTLPAEGDTDFGAALTKFLDSTRTGFKNVYRKAQKAVQEKQ